MSLIFNIKDGNWSSVRQAIAKLGSTKLGPTSTPTFASTGITGLTTNSLLYSASGGILTSLGVATNGQLPIGSTGATPVLAKITGTANQITSTPGPGTITLATPQDIHTGASPTFANLILSNDLTVANQAFIGGVTSTKNPAFTPISHWKMNDNLPTTNVVDAMGVNDGTLVKENSEDKSVAGRINTALDFDGDNDYFTVADSPSLNINEQITVSVWIKRGRDGTREFITSKGPTGDVDTNDWEMEIRSNNEFEFIVWINETRIDTLGTSPITDTDWHHVVGTYDGERVHAYLDGVRGAGVAASGSIQNMGNPIGVGASSSGLLDFMGAIDDFRIYNVALTSDEIALLYNSGQGTETTTFQVGATHQVVATSAAYTSSHSLDSLADLAIEGKLEVNGAGFIDGLLTLGGNVIIPDGGTIGNGVQLAFDDTNNYLEITGASIGINETAPETLIEMSHATPTITGHCITHSDALNARAVIYQAFGEQSGGEETTLGKWMFAHDSAADDEKGYWKLFINTGSDGDSPTEAFKIGSDLLSTFAGSFISSNYEASNKLTACATNAGALDFSAGSKTITVEDDAVVSQDYSSDASPQFTGIELGHVSDTTLTRVSAGVIAVEGTNVMLVGDAATAHNLLDGSVHGDTIADTVTRGSIVYCNSTPNWDELVIGAANTFLGSDGTDLSYRTAAQIMASLSGAAGAGFSFNSQALTSVGAVGCGAITSTATGLFQGASVTVGVASTTTGTLVLHDSNSANTITLTVPDISAGSLSFTLPPTDGDNTNVLQTDGNGVLTWVVAAGADVKVGIDVGATPDYIGAANSDGVLRTGTSLSYTDGGDFITINTVQDLRTSDSPTFTAVNTVGGKIRIQEQAADFSIVDTTVIGTLEFYGDDDTASADAIGAQIQAIATSTWTDGAEDAKLVLNAANDGMLNANQLVLDTTGNIGVNTTNPTPANKNTMTPIFVVSGGGLKGSIQVVRHTTVGSGGGFIALSATRGTDANSYTILQNNDGIGTFGFQGADGTQFVPGAEIKAQVDGTPGTNDMPGRLIFATTADGASAPTDRMTITSTGQIGIGKSPNYQLELSTDSAGKPTSNTWDIVSDERIKTNIKPFTDGLDLIMQIRPITYNYNELSGFIEDGSMKVGIIAQELQTIAPYMVGSHKAELDGEVIDMLDYQGHALAFIIVNALQELQLRNKALKDTCIQLDNKISLLKETQ